MIEKRMIWFSLGLLIIGFAGGYALEDPRMAFALYHAGGLSGLVLLAGGAGAIARRKGYGFWRAFWFALSPAILLGGIFAYLSPPAGDDVRPAVCGGSVSLVVAFIAIIYWALKKPRDKP